jgi:hypothetical protein
MSTTMDFKFLAVLLAILQVTFGVIIKDLNQIPDQTNSYDFIIVGGK